MTAECTNLFPLTPAKAGVQSLWVKTDSRFPGNARVVMTRLREEAMLRFFRTASST